MGGFPQIKKFYQGGPYVGYWVRKNIPALGQPWYSNWEEEINKIHLQPTLTVRDLFDFNTDRWSTLPLQHLFSDTSIQQINNLNQKPTQNPTIPDALIWRHAKNGKFKLKIAYQILSTNCTQTQPNQIWNIIWETKNLMPKVKAFLWRAVHSALPTMYELKRRIPRLSPMCPRCGMENETIPHMLFTCYASRVAWFISPMSIKTEELPLQILDILQAAYSTIQTPDINLFFYMMWTVWKSRNSFVFQAKEENPNTIVAEALALHNLSCKNHDKPTRHPPCLSAIHLPNQVQTICLIDGSWDTTGRGGTAAIFYDKNRRVQHIHGSHNQASSPFHAETMALLNAINESRLIQAPLPMIILTDCKQLVQFIRTNDSEYLQDWKALKDAHECKMKMNELDGQQIILQHIRRDIIADPHKLANCARVNGLTFRGFPTQICQRLEISQQLPAFFTFF